MTHTDPTIQSAVITETLKAMGYYAEETASGTNLIKVVNESIGYCFRYTHGNGWEFELLAICKQAPEFLGTYKDDVHKKVLEMALGLDRESARSEAYEEGREDMRWEAQADFEQAYWEYLDGANSDFDPSIYGQRES